MAFGNFWRGDRQRGGERSRGSGEWRNAERERDANREHERHGSGREGRSGWSPGGEYYSDRGADYGTESYGSERYRGQGAGEDFTAGDWESGRSSRTARQTWDDEGRRYADRRDWRQDYGDSYGYGAQGGFGRPERGSESDNIADYGRDYTSPDNRYSRAADYARRGAGGYGEARNEYRSGTAEHGGQHRGRGPRGYRRSDERIREDLCDCLTEDAYIDATNLEILVKDGEVTLSGSVNTREEKRRAEDLSEGISGVKDVHNNVRVTPPQQPARGGNEPGAGQKPEASSTQTSRH